MAVTLLVYTREVLGSNIGWNTDISIDFRLSLQAYAETILGVGHDFPSKYFITTTKTSEDNDRVGRS
jgi:hypothetical protein